MDAYKVLTMLQYDHRAISTPLAVFSGLDYRLSKTVQELTKELLDKNKTVEWILDPFSPCLFYNGLTEPYPARDLKSAMNLVTCTLTEVFQAWRPQSVSVLYAFCGYDGAARAVPGFRGLLPSLICQLLLQRPQLAIDDKYTLSMMDSDREEEEDQEELFEQILWDLVRKLPSNQTVLIALDNVQRFVYGAQTEPSCVLNFFKTMIETDGLHGKVKLLITSVNRLPKEIVGDIFTGGWPPMQKITGEEQGFDVRTWQADALQELAQREAKS